MATGQLAQRYNPLQVLGEGAMGKVWLAEDTLEQRSVALKQISRAAEGAEKSTLQLKQEFRLMSLLRHPNCCEVYDYGETIDGTPYFTMEVVEGQGLDELVPMAAERAREVLAQLLLALGYVHQQGLVHRDVKSANVRIRPDGVVKVMDFGLMEHAGRSGAPIKGTLEYLSPEVVKRGAVDQRADLYSVGCLAYEMLTGRPPFQRSTPIEVLRAHVSDRPEPPSRLVAGIPAELERVVLKLLEKEPIARYSSAHEVLEDLGVEVPAGLGGTLLSAPLVEREAELARLSEGLAEVAAGRGTSPLLFSGASGLSKSRLVEELRFRAQLENLPCVVAGNHEFAGSPYAPVMTLLRGLMPAFKSHVRPALDRLAPVLVKLLPELAVEPLPELDPPSKEKMRLMAAIAELLGALARTAGLVLALEDWQWADPLSDEFLSYLLRNAAEWPLLVVLTMREAPVAGRGWLERMDKRSLKPLGHDGIRRMLIAMLGSEAIAPSFVSSVAMLSDGNPAFVEMLLEHLVTSGTLQTVQRRWNTEIALTSEHLPQDLRELQLRKLMRLSQDAQAIARAAAVVGYTFGIELLKGVSDYEDERLFAALDELVHGQVFALDEQGDYHFVQDQLQEVLYDGLAPEERTRLHTDVGLALESALAGAPLAEVSLERLTAIADQFMRGAAPDKTVRFCLETGRRSAALLAGTGAAVYLEAGMRLLREGHGNRRLLLDYLHHWGDVLRQQSDHERADEAYREALALAAELGDHGLRAELLTSLAKSYQSQSRLEEALTACEQALDACREANDQAETSRCLLTASRVHYLSGQVDAAIVDAEAALALARGVDDAGKSGMALAFLGYLFATTRPGKCAQGIAYLYDALKLVRALGDKIGLINALDSLAYALVLQGDFAEARELYLEQQQLCYEIGHRNEEALCLCDLSRTALKLGAIDQALKDANGASFLAAQLQSKHPQVLAQIMEALALLHAGKLAKVQSLADSALELARSLNNRFLEGHVLYYQLEMLVQLGQLTKVREQGLALKALLERAGNPEPESRVNALLGEAAVYEGRLEEAQELFEHAERLARATGAKWPLLIARKSTVRLLIAAGQWESALPVAEQALAYAAAIGARYQQAELHGLLGELALAMGSGDAAEHFRAMAELAIAMPAPALLAIARFGQAAAQPYAPEARARADEARALLTELVQPLAEADRQAFLSLSDRARAIAGNYIDYSLPRTRQAVPLRAIAWERL